MKLGALFLGVWMIVMVPCSALDYSEEGGECFFLDGQSCLWNLEMTSHGDFLGFPRNYYAPVTAGERADIRYIVMILANKSLVTIAKYRSELEEAGDRINHLHPLKFLMTLFFDEEMKVAIRNIRSRAWVWDSFYGGLKESLVTESRLNNIKDEYVGSFAAELGIDPRIVRPAIQQENWDLLIDLLIKHVPRSGNHNRYDN